MNIALCGLMRSGKDSVGNYLCEQYGYTRFAFGDGIREVTRRLYPELYADGKKPRSLLQGFGQMARTFDEDVWVNDCFRRIGEEREHRQDYAWFYGQYHNVITDLRQPNEYERCRAEGYVIIRVTTPDGLRIQRAIDAKDTFNYADLAHETESHVSSFVVDYEIENSGSLAELYAKVDEFITKINEKVAVN